LADTGIVDISYVRHLIEEHEAARRDYSASIWTLLMFESFLRNIADEGGRAPAREAA
jgi:asparagine synthase (glutamine-hydrolysing)